MTNTEHRIGDLLIKKGYLNHQQLTRALEFQAKLPEEKYMQLGEILISFGIISPENLSECLGEQGHLRSVPVKAPPEPVIKPLKPALRTTGSLIPPPPPPPPKSPNIQATPGMQNISRLPPPPAPPSDKAKMAIANMRKNMGALPPPPPPPPRDIPAGTNLPLGEILVAKGYMDRAQLTDALEYQASLPATHYKPIGDVLVELEMVTREQIDEAMGKQKPMQNTLGDILKQLGIIDDSQLAMVLMQQHAVGGKHIPIGELLVEHGFISKEQLEQALTEQKRRQSL